jgi:hypothetical protein
MSRSTKSNKITGPDLSRHVMSPAQLARRLELDRRAIDVPGVNQLGRYRYAAAYEHMRTQSHPADLLICFLARGRQIYRIRDTLYHLQGNDQHVVMPGEPHDTAGWPEEKGELYWLSLQVRPARAPLLHLTPGAAATLRRALLALPSVTGQMLALDGGEHLQWAAPNGQRPEE